MTETATGLLRVADKSGSDPPDHVVPEDHVDAAMEWLAAVEWQHQRYGWIETWWHRQWPCPTAIAVKAAGCTEYRARAIVDTDSDWWWT